MVEEVRMDQAFFVQLVHDLQVLAKEFPVSQGHNDLAVSQADAVSLGVCTHITHGIQDECTGMLGGKSAADGVLAQAGCLDGTHGVNELIQSGRDGNVQLLQIIVVHEVTGHRATGCRNAAQAPDVAVGGHNLILQVGVLGK